MAENRRLDSDEPPVALASWRAALPALIACCALYLAVLHPWMMSWGTSEAERAMALPGDDGRATGEFFTRAIDVSAPPEDVWRWIVQIGQDRAGFYSNSWLENLTGADIHNAQVIRSEWQGRTLGDQVPLARPDLFWGVAADAGRTEIQLLDAPRVIANIPGRFILRTAPGNKTRLLVRESLDSQGPALTRWLVWDPMHFVMVQRMMRGIKERAEGEPLVSPALSTIARLGWLAAGFVLLGFSIAYGLARSRLALPAALGLMPPAFTGDWDAGLAAFLAVGITVTGALAYGRRWWPAYTLLAAVVLLTLLLAPDAYAAFGLIFALLIAIGTGRGVVRRLRERRRPHTATGSLVPFTGSTGSGFSPGRHSVR